MQDDVQEIHSRHRRPRGHRRAVHRHHAAGQPAAARREVRPHGRPALHHLRRHRAHRAEPQGAGEPLSVLLGKNRHADPADCAITACACASCSKSWRRARTASSRSRSSIRSRFPKRKTAPPSSAVTSVPISASGEKLYLGLAATNSTDGKEAIPFLDPQLEEQLEYDVAKLIHKLSSAKKPVIGWLSSLPMQGDFDMQTGRPRPPWVVYGQVEQLYTVRNLEPSLTTIDDDVDVLVLVHPKELPPAALYAIDQFAMRGGHMLAFVDPSAQADQSGADPNNPMAQFAADKSSHLEPLLSSWGVEFKSDQVVADLERGLTVSMREGEPPSQHIAILGFDAASMAKDVITARLDCVNVATAGSLKAMPSKSAAPSSSSSRCIRTSKQAGLLPVQRITMMSDPRQSARRLQAEWRARGRGARLRQCRERIRRTARPQAPRRRLMRSRLQPSRSTWWSSPIPTCCPTSCGCSSATSSARPLPSLSPTTASWSGTRSTISAAATTSSAFAAARPIRGPSNASRRCAARPTRSSAPRSSSSKQQLQQTEEQLNKLQTAQPGGSEAILSARSGAGHRSLPGRKAAHPQRTARDQGAARNRTSRRWACR